MHPNIAPSEVTRLLTTPSDSIHFVTKRKKKLQEWIACTLHYWNSTET